MSGATIDWSRVKTLFAQALDQPRDTRDAWLAAQCVGDRALLAEVSSLLAARSAPESRRLGRAIARLLPSNR